MIMLALKASFRCYKGSAFVARSTVPARKEKQMYLILLSSSIIRLVDTKIIMTCLQWNMKKLFCEATGV